MIDIPILKKSISFFDGSLCGDTLTLFFFDTVFFCGAFPLLFVLVFALLVFVWTLAIMSLPYHIELYRKPLEITT